MLTLDPGIGDLANAGVILLRTDQVNVAPVVDPVATVVIAADTSNVDTVIVAGRIAKHHGRLMRVDFRESWANQSPQLAEPDFPVFTATRRDFTFQEG